MGLRKYFSKRSFDKTPEPKGRIKKAKAKKLAFVIQKHHASSLHYDFRLELDGVLKSWAVPKGPSLNPHDQHLAMEVEDHPYSYRTFEGIIPEGNYGAGNVIVWDEGWYEPYHDGPDNETTLRKQLKKGHLTFILHGQKLNGEFALIKMRGKDDKAWLLIKKDDEFASESIDITKQDTSVKSGRHVDELSEKLPNIGEYPKIAKPWRVTPMLCTLIEEPFNSSDWLFEIKWDGYRAIASKYRNDVEFYSRTYNDFSTHYPPIVEAVKALNHDVILDGEIVVTNEEGEPRFEWLQNWRRAPHGVLTYQAFDLLWYDGHDLRDMPLIERKQLLRALIPTDSLIRYSDHVESNGAGLFKQIQARGLEGIVAKKAASTYEENNRGAAWLKIKTHLRQEVVIGGFTEPRGGRKDLGSLIVGVYDKGELIYTGHSGGGIPDEQRKLLRAKLNKLERKTSPFKDEPQPNAPVHWVRPELVCEMSFSEWTSDKRMRQPKYEGLRPDKQARDVKRESPKAISPVEQAKKATVTKSVIEYTHLDKVFFPKHGYTKGDVIEYYESVADVMLPYLKDRPHSLLRQPHGITGESFFQKNMEHLPDWAPTVDIFSESNNKHLHWLVGGALDTLRLMVQLGTIEINPWNSRVGHLNTPDWLVIDLDPEGVSFQDVIKTALVVKDVCDEWKIPCVPKTSGKTGIHIYVPLGTTYDYEQSKNLAHLIALEVNRRLPNLTSVERNPEKRHRRIYLDFLQNRRGQTLAAPYSVRPTPDATVSTPLHWDEVTRALKPTNFTIQNTRARIDKIGDIWQPVLGKGIDLSSVLKKLE